MHTGARETQRDTSCSLGDQVDFLEEVRDGWVLDAKHCRKGEGTDGRNMSHGSIGGESCGYLQSPVWSKGTLQGGRMEAGYLTPCKRSLGFTLGLRLLHCERLCTDSFLLWGSHVHVGFSTQPWTLPTKPWQQGSSHSWYLKVSIVTVLFGMENVPHRCMCLIN